MVATAACGGKLRRVVNMNRQSRARRDSLEARVATSEAAVNSVAGITCQDRSRDPSADDVDVVFR